MIPRLFSRCLLRPEDLAASQDDLIVVGAFNPGAVATAEGVVLMIRVAEKPRQVTPGYVGLPRWEVETGRVITDWLTEEEVIFQDARVVKIRKTGLLRLTFTSHLRMFRSTDGRSLEAHHTEILRPRHPYEAYGMEDPRMTAINDSFYMTYVAVSRHGAATALASTRNFCSFESHGLIFCPENKDVVLFPETIDGQYLALHRPTTAHAFSRPEIWLATSPDRLHWGRHQPLLGSSGAWDRGRIGAGTPPIRTSEGWLAIYHGNDKGDGDSGIGSYGAGLLLLDLDEPGKIRRSIGPILVAENEYECQGFVPNVVFPTGIINQGETVLIYYGAADTSTGVVELRLSDLLEMT
jgi:predicted GH43/DUF377 family glycosyl hydrolase